MLMLREKKRSHGNKESKMKGIGKKRYGEGESGIEERKHWGKKRLHELFIDH